MGYRKCHWEEICDEIRNSDISKIFDLQTSLSATFSTDEH